MTRIFKAIAENERAELTPEEYAQLAEMRGDRTCDGCAMCCKLPSIEEPEMTKTAGAWCDHCDTGRARCRIYDGRPAVCASFHCGWLLFGNFVPEYWKPSRSRMMIHMPELIAAVKIVVDKAAYGKWREDPWISDIYRMRDQFQAFGVDVFLEEIHKGGMWFFTEHKIIFIPQDWQLVKLGKYPFDEYCPMPSIVKDEYLASGDLVRLSIWNDYFPKRKTIPVKRK